jgi:hypothetical protein
MEQPAATHSRADFLWIARGWLAGVFVFALRIALGLLVLEHLRRRNVVALPDALVGKFLALQRRLGIRRVIRYAESRSLSVPAVVGFLRPVILLPMRAITGLSLEQLEAVIAHELGHIQRLDVVVNFFQVIAETLFFFHPAVWWLNHRIRADREDCCDDIAIAACGGTVGYARALATMEGWRDVPGFAMAATGSSVAARVARLLGVKRDTGARAAGVVTATIVFATALLAGTVSMGLARPAFAKGDAAVLQQLVAQAEQAVAPEPAEVAEPTIAEEPAIAPQPAAAARPAASPRPASSPRPPAAPPPTPPVAPLAPTAPPAPAPAAPSSPVPPVSYIEAMKSVGFDNLEVDDLIAMKIHDIDTDFVRRMRAIGFKPDAQELIAMKIHGVSPDYVKAMRDLGFTPDAQEIVAMKIQDISPEYVKDLRAAGFEMSTQEIIHAKIMDITPEFIRAANAHGFKDLTAEKLIQLKVADIL